MVKLFIICVFLALPVALGLTMFLVSFIIDRSVNFGDTESGLKEFGKNKFHYY